ncbi:MAG: YdcF family protein, partial [Verrucomicrobia bacterium]|nr:YdcF family protein [Verrucomicrobiota bacterium]
MSKRKHPLFALDENFELIAFSILFSIGCYVRVHCAGRFRLFRSLELIPSNQVGLVLGTAKTLRNSAPNQFFHYRINAAAQLYRAGKVQQLLLSGHAESPNYDEPCDMKKALLAQGVPENALKLDKKGFRTSESIIRAKQVFGLQRLTIVSQEFHVRRALFFCNACGVSGIGFLAKGPRNAFRVH